MRMAPPEGALRYEWAVAGEIAVSCEASSLGKGQPRRERATTEGGQPRGEGNHGGIAPNGTRIRKLGNFLPWENGRLARLMKRKTEKGIAFT